MGMNPLDDLSHADVRTTLRKWVGAPVRATVEVEGQLVVECEGWLVELETQTHDGVHGVGVAASAGGVPVATLYVDHEQYSWARVSESVDPLSLFVQLLSDQAAVEMRIHRIMRPTGWTRQS